MPSALEAGTLNGHGIAGLNAAIKHINEKGMNEIRMTEQRLAEAFYFQAKPIPGIRFYGDFSSFDRAPTTAFNLCDMDSGMLCSRLADEYGIFSRGGGHCAPLMHQALGTEKQGAVRFSFSWRNTAQEVDEAIHAVRELAE